MKKTITLFLILIATAFSQNLNFDLLSQQNKTSGLEPIDGLGEEFRKSIKSARLQSVDDEDLKERIQQIITERLNSFNLNNQYGISVAFHTPDLGIQTATAGYSDIVTKEPITPDMTFQVASITKWMVSTLIFKLQEEGKLNLSDEVSNYIDGYTNLDANFTIARLLTHKTNYFDYLNQSPDLFLRMYTDPNTVPDLETLLNNLPAYNRQDLSSSEYSNTNYVILAKIIEAVTGEDYYEYLKSTIIEPLGLENTYSGRFPEDNDNPVAEGWFNDAYWRTGISRMSEVDFSKLMELSYGLGDVYSTPTDLVKYALAWMDGELIQDIQPQTADVGNGFAYGNFLEIIGGKKAVFHSGSLLGYSSFLYTIPEDEFALAICINSNNASFAFYPNRLQTVLGHIVQDIYDIDLDIRPELKIHSLDLVELEGNNNGIAEPGEKIELSIVARDVSGSTRFREFVNYNVSSEDVNIWTNSKDGSFMDTGYNYLDDEEGEFSFVIPDNYDKDFAKFNLTMNDNINNRITSKEFLVPIGETEASAYFDGSYASTVQVPISNIEAPEAMTFESWIYVGDMSSQMPGGQISSIAWLGYNAAVFVVNSGFNPIIFFQLTQEDGRMGQALFSDESELNFGKWAHIAITYNENNELKMYLNGVEQAYQINSGNFGGDIDDTYPQVLSVGSMPTLADINQIPNFIGNLDNVRYWGRALSEEEIVESMNGLPENTQGLIANLEFDNGVSSLQALENSIDQSANFHAYYGENTSYDPGSVISNIEEKSSTPLYVFPNPTNGYINLDLDTQPEKIEIYDLHGIKLFDLDNSLFEFSGDKVRVDVNELSVGAHIIEATVGKEKVSRIFIKK